jgi:predicted metal-dependent HD superfamily phosphohydrolase
MIVDTATHAATSPASAVLIDADLAILAADPAGYQGYVNGVRAEYGHIDNHGWQVGRAAVLRHFLDRPQIFTSAAGVERYEQRARANLSAELASLTPRHEPTG